jgi:hypothetical protein
MRICPKCLSVYGSYATQFCPNDGKRTVDLASKEALQFIKKKKEATADNCGLKKSAKTTDKK